MDDELRRAAILHKLDYMGLKPGEAMADIAIDRVFIGSCTNGRIEDLRAAAKVIAGRTVNANVNAMVVPGSGLVKAQAEAEGLDKVFTAAGFEWREPGCSMCLAMNADKLMPGERCASTSNRNFEGRQGFQAAAPTWYRPPWRRRRRLLGISSTSGSGISAPVVARGLRRGESCGECGVKIGATFGMIGLPHQVSRGTAVGVSQS